MAATEAFETEFLREFANTYVSEITYSGGTWSDIDLIQDQGYLVGLADVLYVLKTGSVTNSDKRDSDGAFWEVEGTTCHDANLVIRTQVWCDCYKIRVLNVAILGENNA
ncbi:hypothetical protein [Pseudosulfitobacter sp. SM2401]|uniref:hypothetical protein n=1 Tax=Pseudosulfitobacter sp. SM2401 TaxID=3350098 RepID=UPI0036F221FD